MRLTARWYRGLRRFNAFAIPFILLLLIFPAAQTTYWLFGSLDKSCPEVLPFGRASAGEMPLVGEPIPTKDSVFVKYFIVDADDQGERKKGSNITIVDTRNGKSHKILADDDRRNLVGWELIYTDKSERQALAYVAWVATDEMEAQGRADLLIAGLPDLKQYILAKNIKYNDALQLYGSQSVAMVLWKSEEVAEFTVFDLQKGKVTQSVKVDLPVNPENRLERFQRN